MLKRLSALPPDAARALDAALDRAEVRAQIDGGEVAVQVTFVVKPGGDFAVEVPRRYEWSNEAPRGA